MFLNRNRTLIFAFSREALTRLGYQYDNRGAATHPKSTADKKRSWHSIVLPMVRGSNPLDPTSRVYTR